MDTKVVLKSQYLAALAMLRQAVACCPEALWDDRVDKNRFWHVAYHALFYTHLYLQDTLETFVPWAQHRKQPPRRGAPAPAPHAGNRQALRP
jgi:hypothetical protein